MLRNSRLHRNEYQGIKMDDYGAFGDVHILTTITCKLSGEEYTEPQLEILYWKTFRNGRLIMWKQR